MASALTRPICILFRVQLQNQKMARLILPINEVRQFPGYSQPASQPLFGPNVAGVDPSSRTSIWQGIRRKDMVKKKVQLERQPSNWLSSRRTFSLESAWWKSIIPLPILSAGTMRRWFCGLRKNTNHIVQWCNNKAVIRPKNWPDHFPPILVFLHSACCVTFETENQ